MQPTIADLHGQVYKNNVPLPYWGQFYLKLGSFLSERPFAETKTIVVCSVPTRSFAVSLAGTGITLSRIKMGVRQGEVEAHFRKLSSLPIGASLFYRNANRSYKAKFFGITEKNGERHISFKTQEDITTTISEKLSLRLQIVQEEEFELPKKRNQNGRLIPPPPPLLNLLCTSEETGRFATQSNLEALFIGVENRLRSEICGVDFSLLGDGEGFVSGPLNDIVQLFEKESVKQTYHSRILSSSSDTRIKNVPEEAVVLFDGCLPYQRFHRLYQKNNALVVLDRTEPSFVDTVGEINSRFTMKRLVTDEPLTLPFDVPPGVEVMLWEEKKT